MSLTTALLLAMAILLALLLLAGGVVLLALSLLVNSAGKLDPHFKEPRHEC